MALFESEFYSFNDICDIVNPPLRDVKLLNNLPQVYACVRRILKQQLEEVLCDVAELEIVFFVLHLPL